MRQAKVSGSSMGQRSPSWSENLTQPPPSGLLFICSSTPSIVASSTKLGSSSAASSSNRGPRQHMALHTFMQMWLASWTDRPGIRYGGIGVTSYSGQTYGARKRRSERLSGFQLRGNGVKGWWRRRIRINSNIANFRYECWTIIQLVPSIVPFIVPFGCLYP